MCLPCHRPPTLRTRFAPPHFEFRLFDTHKFVRQIRKAHFCPRILLYNMRSNLLFYVGLALNLFSLYLSIGSISTLFALTQNFDGTYNGGTIGDGMTAFGRLMTWLIPLVLIALMALAFGLRAKGKLLAANILVCIPALPMLAMIVFWGGLALLFILFGK